MSPRAPWFAPALSLVAFWSGLWLAARAYPAAYDWRYLTISTLLYSDRNPAGYLWGRAGLVLCALWGLMWVLGGPYRPVTRGVLGAGYVGMVLCALVPSPFLGLAKPHEWLAVTAFLCVCLGAVRLALEAPAASGRARTHWRRLASAVVPVMPILGAAVSQIYAAHAHLPWPSMAWRARGIPFYWSFAFWEWLACAACTGSLLWLGTRGRFRPVT